MEQSNKRSLSIMDGGIIFLISVTLLLVASLVFAFLFILSLYDSSVYYSVAGIAELVAVGVPVIIYLKAKKVPMKHVFKKKISIEQIVLVALIAVFGYPILGMIKILWTLLLEALKVPVLSSAIPGIDNIGVFIISVVAVSLIPGFFEEIVFRGVIQNSLQKKNKASKSILITAVLFMLMHGDVYAWTYTFSAGVALGLIFYYTGSLWATVVYHCINNFIGVFAIYFLSAMGIDDMLTDSYSLLPMNSDTIMIVVIYLVASIVCFGICALLFWGLSKVTKKEEYQPDLSLKTEKIALLPYFVGGAIMVIMAVLPEIVAAIVG